ncbi:tyrosine-type recombinase/integrase [Pandoraea nosoerga]|nr:tyrosine-type recombinase/integrase [Pandoraea nosoerga]
MFSLGICEKPVIREKSVVIESQLLRLLKEGSQVTKDNIRKYEIDFQRGVFKAEGPEDHARLVEALKIVQNTSPKVSPAELPAQQVQGLKPLELLEKFLTLKSHLKPATAQAYKNIVGEFSSFLKNPLIGSIGVSDITRYQEHIAKTNAVRTVDNKIGALSALFNFGIKQGYYFGENPAEGRALMTKKQRLKTGYDIFEDPEIQQIFDSEFMRKAKIKDPDYYYVIVLCLVTGCRIGEVTSLEVSQFQQTAKGNFFVKIRDSKTVAGIREVPLPESFFSADFKKFVGDRKGFLFKYQNREGKGTGNAAGKKFARHLVAVKITRPKLVPHSLRKYLNNHFMKNGIQFEPRCQMLGHETDNVNVATYTKKFTPDELSEMVGSIQNQLLIFTKVLKTEF